MFERVLNTPVFRLHPGNVLCHHSKHLMGYFEFLNGSRIIRLLFNISEKLQWQNVFEKLEEEALSTKRELPPFFHSDTNTWPRSDPFCWQNPCPGCNSETDLVVVLECIFFQLCSTRNRSLRFTRFRRSYVNRFAVVLTNHCQSTLFLPHVCSSKWPRSLFIYLFILLFFFSGEGGGRGAVCLVHFRSLFLLSTRVARMLLSPRWVSSRKDVKWFSINISKLTLGVKHSINRKITLRKLWNVCPFYNINITIFPLHI